MGTTNKPPTINDVARLSGVSKRTVSRVLNGSPKVNIKTRESIYAIIKELNFKPNRHARGLAANKSYLIGLIFDNPDALYMDDIQRGAIEILSKAGFELLVHPCSYEDENLLPDILDFVARARLDGVIILPPLSELSYLADSLRAESVPYVRIASSAQDELENMIVSKDQDAVYELTKKLISIGHTKIGFIKGPENYISAQQRLAGFSTAIEESDISLNEEWITYGDYSFESGKEAGQKLMNLADRPTVIIASNDLMAIGAMHSAKELNLIVPDDISIAGFDDSLIASKILPTLTTICRPVRKMANMAARKLLLQISNEPFKNESIETYVTPELIIRDSTIAHTQT